MVEVGVIERVEQLRAEFEFEALGELERFVDADVQIPVMRRDKNIAAGAIRTWRRNRKGTIVYKDHRAKHASLVLQFRLDRFDHSSTRNVREICRPDTTGNGEWLAAHKSIDAVQTPTTDHCVHETVLGIQPFAFANWQFPHAAGRQHMRAVEVRTG